MLIDPSPTRTNLVWEHQALFTPGTAAFRCLAVTSERLVVIGPREEGGKNVPQEGADRFKMALGAGPPREERLTQDVTSFMRCSVTTLRCQDSLGSL